VVRVVVVSAAVAGTGDTAMSAAPIRAAFPALVNCTHSSC
jgi:hypothetical protein